MKWFYLLTIYLLCLFLARLSEGDGQIALLLIPAIAISLFLRTSVRDEVQRTIGQIQLAREAKDEPSTVIVNACVWWGQGLTFGKDQNNRGWNFEIPKGEPRENPAYILVGESRKAPGSNKTRWHASHALASDGVWWELGNDGEFHRVGDDTQTAEKSDERAIRRVR